MLPFYLSCIESLDYDKKLITVYINTNNNTDATVAILEEWKKKHEKAYAKIILDQHEANIEQSNPHDWNTKRYKLLGAIRNTSLRKTEKKNCDYSIVTIAIISLLLTL